MLRDRRIAFPRESAASPSARARPSAPPDALELGPCSIVASPVAADTSFSAYVVLCNALLSLPGHRFRIALMRRVVRAAIGPGCSIERSVRITTKGGLEIGEGTNVNRGCLLDGRGGLQIGCRVNISPDVRLLTAEHDPDSPHFAGRAGRITIGDSAWLAIGALILPGATIGEGAVVGAAAVVRGEVTPRTIVAGNPAVPIGSRSPEAQRELPPYRRFMH